LAGNYSEKIEDFNEAATNFFNAAVIFKGLDNLEMTYKHYVKAGDNYWKIENVNDSTECYLNAYDIAVEGGLEYNRFGIFNQIVRGLNIIAKEGLKNKQFYTAATLIMESIKFYQQLDTAKDFLVNEMLKNVYRYYYRAANLKKIGYSHIVQSYVMAAISSILNGRSKKALEILSEIELEGKTVKKYKEIVKLIIKWVSEGKEVEYNNFPYDLQRIIKGSEEITYLLKFFKGYKS
jgi:tetratricopeptide (TPR) repeat protein